MTPTQDIDAIIAPVPAVVNVRSKGGTLYAARTSNEIARGGEGRILKVDEDPLVALKLYHPTRVPLSEERFGHLSKLSEKHFVRPNELLYDGTRLAGFSMKLLPKDYFIIQMIFQKDFCKVNGVTSEIKTKVFRGLVEALKEAHGLGIVIGDLNPYNIMVTIKGDVKILDVDSFETPGYKHSGILLEDVRDYFYDGKVSKNSDFFALSVLLFTMACYVHPFKGIHARFKKISDRMINKLPIIKADPELKIPKFYEPLKKGHLLTQFERMYLGKVERFLIDIDEQAASLIATAALPKPDAVKKFEQDQLAVQEVLFGDIEDVSVVGLRVLVRTRTEFIVYDCSNKGYLALQSKKPRSEWDHLFLGDASTIGIKDGSLFIEPSRGKGFVKNGSIPVGAESRFHQVGNYLFVLNEDRLFKLNVNRVIGGNIEHTVDNVLGQSFNLYGGFFFRAGQHQLLFPVDGGLLSILPMPINIVGLY